MRLRLPGRSPAPADTAPDTGTAPGSDRTGAADGRATAPGDRSPAPVGRTPAPAAGRGERLRESARRLAVASAQFLLITAALVIVGYVLGRLWSILLPIVLGLLFATVLWPPTRFLTRHRWPPALAASTVILAFLAVIGGLIAWISPAVGNQAPQLADASVRALDGVRSWLTGPPLNLGEDQIGQAVDSVINTAQNNAQDIAGYALSGATAIGNGLINLVLALVLAFFFIKDGPRWTPWLAAQTGTRAARHVVALSDKTWSTLSEFIRQQALVGFIDAFFIGIGLLVLDVPLVLPLAVLTFFGAFIPIIGAFVAGAFAVLIALVSKGFTTALIVLIIVVVVQQLEGNVLQPIIQGRGFNLHAAVVILAVTAGGSLAGIVGAFLGVPVAALVAVVYRYIRDQLDQRDPAVMDDGTQAVLVGDRTETAVATEQAAPPAAPPAAAPVQSEG